MSVRKQCGNKGCKTSPRCDHPWWLDVMHKGARIRMAVDDFALPRGATAPVTTKQEAEKLWEPKFIAEIVAGRDPRVAPERETATTDGPATVAELLNVYRMRYVEVEPLKSRPTILSQLNVLASELGQLPAKALERPDAIEDFKAGYTGRAVATTNRYLARLRHICNWAIGRNLLTATPFHSRGVKIVAKNERRRDRRITEAEECHLLGAAKRLNEPPRGAAKLTWDLVREIRARARAGVSQRELASAFHISPPLCSQVVSGAIWDPAAKLTTGDEMRDRIIGALDTCCRRGEMMKIQNKHVDWPHRWIRILKENSKSEVARVIPFDADSRLEKVLRRRVFLGPDAFVFGEASTGAYVKGFRSAWETLLLLSNGIEPERRTRKQRPSNRDALSRIDLHWHDLRHEALSRLADDGVPVHELQMLAGHANITTTQRYMNARASSLAESMRHARERRANRTKHDQEGDVHVG
jgi:integrase